MCNILFGCLHGVCNTHRRAACSCPRWFCCSQTKQQVLEIWRTKQQVLEIWRRTNWIFWRNFCFLKAVWINLSLKLFPGLFHKKTIFHTLPCKFSLTSPEFCQSVNSKCGKLKTSGFPDGNLAPTAKNCFNFNQLLSSLQECSSEPTDGFFRGTDFLYNSQENSNTWENVSPRVIRNSPAESNIPAALVAILLFTLHCPRWRQNNMDTLETQKAELEWSTGNRWQCLHVLRSAWQPPSNAATYWWCLFMVKLNFWASHSNRSHNNAFRFLRASHCLESATCVEKLDGERAVLRILIQPVCCNLLLRQLLVRFQSKRTAVRRGSTCAQIHISTLAWNCGSRQQQCDMLRAVEQQSGPGAHQNYQLILIQTFVRCSSVVLLVQRRARTAGNGSNPAATEDHN